jgi:phage-related protein
MNDHSPRLYNNIVIVLKDRPDVPVLDWLKELRRTDQRAYASCVAAIGRLSELGHELRRPLADFLRDGIYELRIRKGRVHYRILYFFHGRNLAILGHALTKEDKVVQANIERAIRRKKAFEENPAQHSYSEEE